MLPEVICHTEDNRKHQKAHNLSFFKHIKTCDLELFTEGEKKPIPLGNLGLVLYGHFQHRNRASGFRRVTIKTEIKILLPHHLFIQPQNMIG